MGPRDWFGVGVRLVGIWCVVMAAQHLFYYLDVLLGFSPTSFSAGRADPTGNPSGYLVYVIGYTVAGIGLNQMAEPLMDSAYPLERRDEEEYAEEELSRSEDDIRDL